MVRKQRKEEKLSEDEIDAFISQKSKVSLEDSDDNSSDGYGGEETVMDLPSSDESGNEDEEEVDQSGWGRSKKVFYSADTAEDDLDEEAEEARKQQKKQLKGIQKENFGVVNSSFTKSGVIDFEMSEEEMDTEESEDEEDEMSEDKFDSESELQNLDTESVENMLPETEKLLLLSKNEKEVRKFLKEFNSRIGEIKEQIEPSLKQIKETDTKNGLSFLETKYQLLLAYCANLAYYLTLKVGGRKKIDKHPVIERLVKYRLLIEKIKPLESKLQHHVDKLMRAAETGAEKMTQEDKSLSFRPNLAKLENESSEDSEDERDATYKAPKVNAVHFDEGSRKQKREEERQKLLASRSRLMNDLEADLVERPDEDYIDPVYGQSHARLREEKERDTYEEENFTRLNMSKKDLQKLEKIRSKPIDELEDLNDFFRELEKPKKGNSNNMLSAPKLNEMSYSSKKRSKDDDEEIESEMSDIENDLDEFYEKAESKSKAKKQQKMDRKSAPAMVKYKPIRDAKPGEERPANYEMMKNKGLTPHRPKEVRNPRVHHRNKWEKAQKKIKSIKSVTQNGSRSPYSGETTGIRTNISRSVKF